MNRLVKSYQFCIALLLLISFSATQFPFGLFHQHANTIICKNKSQGTDICQHKSHLATKADTCWACSIHVEKVFLFISPASEDIGLSRHLLKNTNRTEVYFGASEHITLRGPPHSIG